MIGESPFSTTNSYTVTLNPDGSDLGKTFKFRVRANNIYGWGPYSDAQDVLAADVPGVIASSSIALIPATAST